MENENSKLMSLLMGAGLILGASQCVGMEREQETSRLERSLWTIESSQEELNSAANSGCGNSCCNNSGCTCR